MLQQVLQRCQVANRCVEPDVEVFARCIRYLDAKVRRVAADVPITQAFAAAAVGILARGKPFLHLVRDFGLQLAVLRPLLQELHAARVRKFEEEVLRAFEYRRGTRQGRVRVDQVGRRIDRAANLAVVAVLVSGVALGTFAFDKAIRQEHVLLGVEELLDRLGLDQRAVRVVAQIAVNLLRQFVVLWRIGRVPVVKADVKAVQIGLAASGNIGHKLLWRLASLFCGNHDRRAVRIVSTDKIHGVAHHPLVAHPDVGLDVLHDVANMKIAVGVGQGGGDKELAWHGWGFAE